MAEAMTIWARLARLLDEEARAIRAGDLRMLARFPAERAALVAALEVHAHGPDPAPPAEAAALAALRHQAATNQRLLGATLKGIRAGRNRLDGLRRAARSLQSYDASGRPRTIGAPQNSLERRA